MKVLGIDTSTPSGSLGLIDGDQVIAEYLLNIPVTHSERLLGAIERLINEARWRLEDLDGWAIAIGPGSFTGLRIGVSTVKGLAFATGKPVAGIPTLDLLASQIAFTPYRICPIMDARKKEVYAAFYCYEDREDGSFLKRLSDYQAIAPEDLAKGIREKTVFVGDGKRTYGTFLRERLSSLAVFTSDFLDVIHGSTVAKQGHDLLQENKTLDLATFTPIYVRAPEAEIKWHQAAVSNRSQIPI